MLDPIDEIRGERERARSSGDPLADVCFLATVADATRAEVRAISLRDIDVQGFALLINRTSPKWKQLDRVGSAMLLIYWPTVRRQYRVWGPLRPMPAGQLARYWTAKCHGSRLLEWYYSEFEPQSQSIPSHDHLKRGIHDLAGRYPTNESLAPPESLIGIYVEPIEIESWHGSPEDRLHDRKRFTRTEAAWTHETLVP